jgi:hypothetical protein
MRDTRPKPPLAWSQCDSRPTTQRRATGMAYLCSEMQARFRPAGLAAQRAYTTGAQDEGGCNLTGEAAVLFTLYVALPSARPGGV